MFGLRPLDLQLAPPTRAAASSVLAQRLDQLRVKRGVGWRPTFQTVTLAAANGFRAEAEAFTDWIADAGAWNGAIQQESLDIAATLTAVLQSTREGGAVVLS